ncbi:signal transduction histidine kinase [Catenibacillus scindens]|uniref:histidine kinase n=1 Tax=Catenibacillus scindens TaxID=673271 RepID=A0A7W8M575_9FIRM|nr:signal transduction histidine kinase [Catenibacillus scindens]
MSFKDYLKSRASVLLINGAALLVLSVYLLLLKNPGAAVVVIVAGWFLVLAIYFFVRFYSMKKYFEELLDVLDGLDQRYLIAEVMKPGKRLEDRLYWEILRKSNKSVIEKIHSLEEEQKNYKEYIESWIHEVKTPITAAKLICENHKSPQTKQILTELDVIENEVEKVLYYARMEQVHKDYHIHRVNLKDVVLAAIRDEKRHFIQCGMVIDLDMEDTFVSADEKWVEFMLRQIFSNSIKYRRESEGKIKIYVERGANKIFLIVEDNGLGIVPEDLGRIFEKGFTGKNGRRDKSRATGIGLYLCRRLCQKLGMGISCDSWPGSYTKMILTFPDSDFNRI